MEALSQVEDLNLEAITPIAATGHAGNAEELMGQLMKMMLEMQHEQRQLMELQQEKQQKLTEFLRLRGVLEHPEHSPGYAYAI